MLNLVLIRQFFCLKQIPTIGTMNMPVKSCWNIFSQIFYHTNNIPKVNTDKIKKCCYSTINCLKNKHEISSYYVTCFARQRLHNKQGLIFALRGDSGEEPCKYL